MKEGRKPEHPEKTPNDELQKMPHTKARKIKPQLRLEPALQRWWQARKADVLTITPRVAPTGDVYLFMRHSAGVDTTHVRGGKGQLSY